MKIALVPLFLCIFASSAISQSFLEKTAERTAKKVKQRAENRVDKGIDKALDKTEDGLEDAVKGEGKDKSDKKPSNNKSAESGSSSNKTNSSSQSSTVNAPSSSSLQSYSKFDFIPGEKVTAFEDFSQDALGDFPAKWNTNSGGEIVSFSGKEGRWFSFTKAGIYYPEFVNVLPENFTMEMDLIASEDFSEMQSGLVLFFPEAKSRNLKFDYHFSNCPQATVDFHPSGEGGNSQIWVFDKSTEKIMSNEASMNNTWRKGEVNRVSIWRQKNRLRVYVNETKLWDIPRAFLPDVDYSVLFGTNIYDGEIYVSNLRWAEGAPDTRNKLMTEGKIVSRGILFDVNSDKIKPESFGALQDIAKTLNDLPNVKVKIIGHTDADGDDKMNLELSKKRAAAVKQTLMKEFNVDGARLETDGKGELEPADSNSSAVGKANNRRVEFIKL